MSQRGAQWGLEEDTSGRGGRDLLVLRLLSIRRPHGLERLQLHAQLLPSTHSTA